LPRIGGRRSDTLRRAPVGLRRGVFIRVGGRLKRVSWHRAFGREETMDKLALCYAIFLWAGYALGERGPLQDWDGENRSLGTIFADLI